MNKEELRLEITKSLQELEIVFNNTVDSFFSGAHASFSRGGGVIFESFREYKQGDDPRRIDWRTTARFPSRIIVKTYRRKREAQIGFFLDITPSMDFGSTRFSKKDTGILTAAILGCSAFILGDEVDLVGLGRNGVEKEYRWISNKNLFIENLLELKDLSFKKVKKKLNFSSYLEAILGYQGDFIFIISDFIVDNQQEFFRVLEQGAVEHEIVSILISDPREKSLSSSGIIETRDSETGEVFTLDCSKREEFKKIVEGRIKEFDKAMSKLGIVWAEVREDKKWIEELIKLFLQKRYLSRHF